MNLPSSHLLAPVPLVLAVPGAILFVLMAWRAGALTARGAVAAGLIGVIVLGIGSVGFLLPLLAFFLSSSVLSRLRRSENNQATAGPDAVTGARNAIQVLANGGVAAAMVPVFAFSVRHWPSSSARMVLVMYLAALATATADTWATEIGRLSGRSPRLLRNWRLVPAGTSGAISLPGTIAALIGAALIPLAASSLWRLNAVEFAVVTWAGFLGSLLDSLLGAGLQAQFQDARTGECTDRSETAGAPNRRMHGVAWVKNDAVNLLACVGGTLCAWLILHYWVQPFQ